MSTWPPEEPVCFVDPLTGRPLPPAPEPEPFPMAPPVEVPAPDRPILDNPLRVGLSVAGGLTMLSFLLVVVMFGGSTQQAAPPPRPVIAEPGRPQVVPSIIGWRPVTADDNPFVYDVPPDWAVEDAGMVLALEDPNGNPLSLHGVAHYQNGFCAAQDVSSRAQTGFSTIGSDEVRSPRDAARESVLQWADAAFSSADGMLRPEVTLSDPRAVRVFASSVEATEITATIHPAEPSPCGAPSATITAVALPLSTDPASGRYSVHMILADQEVSNALPNAVSDEIISTIRPTT
ncbi:hypothetical protein AB5J62_30160 [Amycolatopsis sp. cg5]|uniref:hypothetical protein n=1 Tax=Amycolatopsis sp. cg5 TaxID=3238802 RepID=UPI003525B2D5